MERMFSRLAGLVYFISGVVIFIVSPIVMAYVIVNVLISH